MKIRTFAIAAAAVGSLAAIPAVANAGDGDGGGAAIYQVTIENLTSGQPLAPAGVVVHNSRADVWSVGSPASAAVAAVAEDANLPVFVSTYGQLPGVAQAFVADGGAIAPGADVTFTIEARPGQRVSLVSMLVKTNDGFTGVDSLILGNGTEVVEVGAYDAGSEINNEDPAFIPGFGNGGVRAPEGNLIMHHPGVTGEANLDMVARITIERTD